jgi:hypothetical protein
MELTPLPVLLIRLLVDDGLLGAHCADPVHDELVGFATRRSMLAIIVMQLAGVDGSGDAAGHKHSRR